MMLQIIIVLLVITVILLSAYILLQKQADDKNNVMDDQTISLNDLKESIEILKSTYGDKSSELTNNINQMYTLLTGSSKAQGQFGEISLKMILEHAGFIENIGYQEQKKVGTEKPDIIINLPEERKVIVDSKVSLTDYSSYLTAQTDEDRELYKKNHLQSVKRHIKTLSSTEYRSLYGNDSLDLIIMFMNVESAYVIACEDEIIKEALKAKIAIVGPTTLIAILQVINRAWSNKKQSEDTSKVIDLATSIYDSAVLVSESFLDFGDLHEKSILKVEQGKKRAQNLINKTEKMRKIGGLEPKKDAPTRLRSINKDQ